jgi:hypothetical protein
MRRAIIAITMLTLTAGGVVGYKLASKPALPTASCGTFATMMGRDAYPIGADRSALACFTAAARACTPASIRVTTNGVDTSGTDVYGVDPGGTPASCQVTDTGQFHRYSGDYVGPITTTHCKVASVTSMGVAITCPGSAPVLIPAASAGPTAGRAPSTPST